MAQEIVNRVAKSGLVSLNLEEFYPKGKRILFDIKENLWQGIALKEKEFRGFIKEHNWRAYQNAYVALHCSVDAIVPTWAYMLITTQLQPFAKKIVFGDLNQLEDLLFEEAIAQLDMKSFQDARIVIKGCSDQAVPPSAYVRLTDRLMPFAKAIMYGEPCSTVPLWKKPKAAH
jgi:Protein of unknown function (DUF2480).